MVNIDFRTVLMGRTAECLHPPEATMACHRAKGRGGYMLGRDCQVAVFPNRALYLPTFNHLFNVNKLLSDFLFYFSLSPLSGLLLFSAACPRR